MKLISNSLYFSFEAKNMQQRRGWLPLLLLGLFVMMTIPVLGQSTFGSVRGVAQDASGAAVPGAKLVLHSNDEDTEKTAAADTSGSFAFENVKAGHYTLRASHDGFAETVINGISVGARQDLRLSATLNIAALSETVEVTSDAAQINTENATPGGFQRQSADDAAAPQ